ncbi:MAG: hypothetical protein ACK4ND_15190, partial [Cytophagaceae bacterium]
EFTTSLEERKDNCIGFKEFENEILEIHNTRLVADTMNSRLDVRYKIVFSDSHHTYSLLFYANYINGRGKGMESRLLRCDNGKWYVDFSRTEEMDRILSKLKSFSFEELEFIFKSEG